MMQYHICKELITKLRQLQKSVWSAKNLLFAVENVRHIVIVVYRTLPTTIMAMLGFGFCINNLIINSFTFFMC
jgi:hypothetical protein